MRNEEREMGKKKVFTKNNRRCESALSVMACTPSPVIAHSAARSSLELRQRSRIVSLCNKIDKTEANFRDDRLGQSATAGFTLAEVLITLTIIGVVAALTIPALIQEWQEKSYKTANNVFISRMAEATRVMNINEKLAGYSGTEEFVDELVKNLKVTKVCKTNPYECFTKEITNGTNTVQTNTLKTAKDFGRDYNTNVVGLILANGYNVLLAYDPDCPAMEVTAKGAVADEQGNMTGAETMTCTSMVYDINSKGKPNQTGKDIHTMGANFAASCVKYGSLCVTPDSVPVVPIDTCDKNNPYDPYFYLGMTENTNYGNPITQASCSANVSAGARKACMDIGMRLPTVAEMQALKSAGFPLFNEPPGAVGAWWADASPNVPINNEGGVHCGYYNCNWQTPNTFCCNWRAGAKTYVKSALCVRN
jgi:prepilin-type N-terminal cleavage/methylation domain-containing protein